MNSINLRVISILYCILLSASVSTATPLKKYSEAIEMYCRRVEDNYVNSAQYKLTVKLIESRLATGQAIKLQIKLENRSGEDIYVASTGSFLRDSDIKIEDSNGNLVQLLEKWKRNPGEPWGGSKVGVEILPGKHLAYQIDIRMFYNLPTGTYKVFLEQPIIIGEIDKKTGEKREIKLKAKPITLVIN